MKDNSGRPGGPHVPYPGCYCADCVEGLLHERHNDLGGYIVGNGDRTKWRAWINGMPVWVDDPADATRYGFRSDANAVHAEDEDAWCVVKYEDVATPSARITGDKDRSVQSRAPTQRIIILTEANRQLAIECHRLRGVLRWIAEVAYVDQHSGNQNFEYLQSVARDGLAQGMSAEGQNPQGFGATPASPVAESDAPAPMGDNRHEG